MQAIKNLILKKYMDFRLKWFKDKSESIHFPQSFHSVKKILLIAPDNQPQLENAVHLFASGLYKIFDDAQVSTFERKTFRPADGNWFGLPSDSYMDNFRQENFDLVIDLNSPPDRLCTYITALSGADLRLNISPGKYDHIYNFHIRTGSELSADVRLSRILEYLKKIKPAKN